MSSTLPKQKLETHSLNFDEKSSGPLDLASLGKDISALDSLDSKVDEKKVSLADRISNRFYHLAQSKPGRPIFCGRLHPTRYTTAGVKKLLDIKECIQFYTDKIDKSGRDSEHYANTYYPEFECKAVTDEPGKIPTLWANFLQDLPAYASQPNAAFMCGALRAGRPVHFVSPAEACSLEDGRGKYTVQEFLWLYANGCTFTFSGGKYVATPPTSIIDLKFHKYVEAFETNERNIKTLWNTVRTKLIELKNGKIPAFTGETLVETKESPPPTPPVPAPHVDKIRRGIITESKTEASKEWLKRGASITPGDLKQKAYVQGYINAALAANSLSLEPSSNDDDYKAGQAKYNEKHPHTASTSSTSKSKSSDLAASRSSSSSSLSSFPSSSVGSSTSSTEETKKKKPDKEEPEDEKSEGDEEDDAGMVEALTASLGKGLGVSGGGGAPSGKKEAPKEEQKDKPKAHAKKL